MSKEKFRTIHRQYHSKFCGVSDDPSTNIADSAFKSAPDCKRAVRSYYEGETAPDRWDGERKAAYLATYVHSAGIRFPTTGIPVEGLFVMPDTGCMHALLHGQCVDFDERTSQFVLTQKGRALIAPFHLVKDREMEAAHASR